jgi:hypothetical protein
MQKSYVGEKIASSTYVVGKTECPYVEERNQNYF